MNKVAVLGQLGIGSVRVEERDPEPLHAGTVRVRLHVASLNYRDLLIAQGHYGPGIALPLVPGSDAAGEVIEVPDDRGRFQIGDRVCTHMAPDWAEGPLVPAHRTTTLGGPADGVFAEERVLPEGALVPLPATLDFDVAACLPVAGLTAWSAIREASLDQKSGRILVLGTGGVSMLGLSLAKALGLEVAITSGAENKLQLARRLGADLTLSRHDPDWPLAVRRWSDGGVDLVLEVGGDGTFDQSLQAVCDNGHIALIGVLAREHKAVRLDEVLMRRIQVNGTFTGPRAELERLVRFVAEHTVTPHVGARVHGLGNLRLAYARLQQARHVGKCIVNLR